MIRLALVVQLTACTYTAPEATSDAAIGEPPATGDGAIDALELGDWGPPVRVGELNSAVTDDDPSVTADLLEIYFASDRDLAATSEDIYVAKRTAIGALWSTPVRVDEVSSSALDSNIDISPDGLTMVLTSRRDGDGNPDLYFSFRPDRGSAWTTPTLVSGLNSPDGEFGAILSTDFLQAMMCSDREIDEAIYTSQRTSTSLAFDAPVELAGLESPADECDVWKSDPQTLYFTSTRPSGAGDIDIYVAALAGITASEVTNLTTLNTADRDGDPWVSADGRTMFFASNRPGGDGSDDIYMSTR